MNTRAAFHIGAGHGLHTHVHVFTHFLPCKATCVTESTYLELSGIVLFFIFGVFLFVLFPVQPGNPLSLCTLTIAIVGMKLVSVSPA